MGALLTTAGGGHVELSTIHYMGKSTLFLVLCTVDDPNYFFNLRKKKCYVS